MIVAVDTNVLISAVMGHGKPRRLVTRLLKEHKVITSREMLAELVDVLDRAKFAKIKKRKVTKFLSIFTSKAEIVSIQEDVDVIPEDPDDNIVLSTASEGNANYILSGDKHLLKLREFRGIRIVPVKEMLELLQKNQIDPTKP